jgi:hypothetical protein
MACDAQAVFSPDSNLLAVNSWTGLIFLWDARPLSREPGEDGSRQGP